MFLEEMSLLRHFFGGTTLYLSAGDFLNPSLLFFFSLSWIRSALREKHFIVLAGAPVGVAPAIPSVLLNTLRGEEKKDEEQIMLQHL